MFSTSNNHPIIPRKSNLILSPHYVTFHSDDRDIQKYPSASDWAIKLPQSISKIFSMTLYDAALPIHKLYVFKKDYQNLAFMVKIYSDNSDTSDNLCKKSKCTPPLNLTRPLEPHINYVQSNIISNKSNYQIQAPTNSVWNQSVDSTNCSFTTSGSCSLSSSEASGCCTEPSMNISIQYDTSNNSCGERPTKLNRSNCIQQTALIKAGVTKPQYLKPGNFKMEDSINNYSFETFVNTTQQKMIRIPEGIFTGEELAEILQQELNHSDTSITWKVYYSSINKKFYFIHNSSSTIHFDFKSRITYQCCDFNNKNQPTVYENSVNWGLGYYLGFNKSVYSFTQITDSSIKNSLPCTTPYLFKIIYQLLVDDQNFGYGLVSCEPAKILGDNVIYMEVNKFNNVDEIFPDNKNSNSSYNSSYQGIVKSAFAKIDISSDSNISSRGPREHYITHMKNQFEDRIDKLSFKFRFHDGRYVYFNTDFNFSIEFNSAVDNPMSNLRIEAQPSWE